MADNAARCGKQETIGWYLLALSFVIGLITLRRGEFGDEAYTLVEAALIIKGFTLYRDVFSHHFPFPSYWAAGIIGLFGQSIVAVRLSILVFQTSAFALGMRVTGDCLSLSIAAIIWSILRTFYRGNMALYSSFAAPALMLIMVVVLAILRGRISPGWIHWLVIGISSVITFLSDPISIYAITIVLVFIVSRKPVWGMKISLVITAGISVYTAYLVATGSFRAFWDSAILFNSQIYNKYRYAAPFRFMELSDMIVRGLGISNKAWWKFNPFRVIPLKPGILDYWLFTGFLYRFSSIMTVLFLALRKQFRAAAFLYLFMASMLIIGKGGFRAQPFIMTALVCVSALLMTVRTEKNLNKFLRTTQILVGVPVLVMTGWLCLRLGSNIFIYRDACRGDQLQSVKDNISKIIAYTCDQPDVLLADYPLGGYSYWFTDMNPVAGYTYMWPWVAEIALHDVMSELNRDNTPAIVSIQDTLVWGKYDTKEYLLPLIEYLDGNYHKVSDDIYLSPELYRRCSERGIFSRQRYPDSAGSDSGQGDRPVITPGIGQLRKVVQ